MVLAKVVKPFIWHGNTTWLKNKTKICQLYGQNKKGEKIFA